MCYYAGYVIVDLAVILATYSVELWGYVDDVILLAPTVTGMNHLLDICTKYGLEYDVLFNPDKTQLKHIDTCKM